MSTTYVITTSFRKKKKPEKKKSSEENKSSETREDIQKKVLRSIKMLNPHQTEKSNSVLKELQSSSEVSINDEGPSEIDKLPTAIDASIFVLTLQQPTKKLYYPEYKTILYKIQITPALVPKSIAKEIVL